MLYIGVNHSAEGVERYFDGELGERLPDERAWRLGGTRSGTVRTPWTAATVAAAPLMSRINRRLTCISWFGGGMRWRVLALGD